MKKLNCKLGDTFGNWTVVDDNTFVKSGHTLMLKYNVSVVR